MIPDLFYKVSDRQTGKGGGGGGGGGEERGRGGRDSGGKPLRE